MNLGLRTYVGSLCFLLWGCGKDSELGSQHSEPPPEESEDSSSWAYQFAEPGSHIVWAELALEEREKIARVVLTRGRASELYGSQAEGLSLRSPKEAYLHLSDNVSFVAGMFGSFVEDSLNYYFASNEDFMSGIAIQKNGGLFVAWRAKDIQAMAEAQAGGWRAIRISGKAGIGFEVEEHLVFTNHADAAPMKTAQDALHHLWLRVGDAGLHQFYVEDDSFYYFYGGTTTARDRSRPGRWEAVKIGAEVWCIDRRDGGMALWKSDAEN